MDRNSYFFYDHEARAFAEVEPDRRALWRRAAAVLGLSLVLSAVGTGVLSRVVTSPVEAAQAQEIAALRYQLRAATDRLTSYSETLDELAHAEREIYRTVLHAGPAADDDAAASLAATETARLAGLPAPTARLIEESAETFDRAERRLALRNRSYQELRSVASDRDAAARQQPSGLPLRNGRPTSGFGMRVHPILRVNRMHAGVDFSAPTGTPVLASGDGRVSYVGRRGGYGTVVEIEHPLAGKMTRYAHLSRVAEGVRVGSAVQRGQTVAYSGNSGLSTAPHLHYEVRRLDAARTPINPVSVLVPDASPAQYRQFVDAGRAPAATFD